jgi:hypothetical protein
MSRQSLKADLRRSIHAGLSQHPDWHKMNHRTRKALVKRTFNEIWRSLPDKAALMQGMEWTKTTASDLVKAHADSNQ